MSNTGDILVGSFKYTDTTGTMDHSRTCDITYRVYRLGTPRRILGIFKRDAAYIIEKWCMFDSGDFYISPFYKELGVWYINTYDEFYTIMEKERASYEYELNKEDRKALGPRTTPRVVCWKLPTLD